jgi:hypothetical protein
MQQLCSPAMMCLRFTRGVSPFSRGSHVMRSDRPETFVASTMSKL